MKNILLLAMSTLGRIEDNYYQYREDGEVFTARSQLEPITHMLSDERKKKGERLDKIIILETDRTVHPDDGKISAVEFYKERVGSFLDDKIEYADILIDEDEPAEGIGKATSIILDEYEKQKKNNDKMNLWIDTQGGFRDVVMVFNAIISLLREQGIEPEGIYSIRFDPTRSKNIPHKIIDQTEKYKIFKFVSAMQEFMDFGKATGLKKYCGDEDALVQAVDGIADAIQMCQPQKFEKALQAFADYLKLERYKKDDPYLQIFVEFMKKDYGILLEEPHNTIEQIRWCVRKEFYQQAVTIYTEKIPKYYHEKGIVTLKAGTSEQLNYGKNPYVNAFYTELFGEMLKDEKDEQLENILYEVKAYKNVNELKNVICYLKKRQEQQDLDATVRTAIGKLADQIQEKFDTTGKKKKKGNKGSKTIQEYIGNTCGTKGRGVRSTLLYGEGKAVKEDSYEKKIRAVQKAKEKSPELVKKMEYYLAMKILRNGMNHANDEEIEGDQQKAIAFLQSERIDIGIDIDQDEAKFDYLKIKKLITDGLECAEQIHDVCE